MTPPPFKALTITSKGGLLPALICQCGACAAFDPTTVPANQQPKFQTFNALWDTGATASVITQQVVAACGLKPIGMQQVHHAGGVSAAETFLVNIGLPNGVAFANVQVTRGQLFGADMLIGMDIITRGDFSITNVGNRTIFSFRVPSVRIVDFVKEAAQLQKAAAPPFYQQIAKGKKHK